MLKGITNFAKVLGGSVRNVGKMLADGMKDVKENGLPEVSPEDIKVILNKRTLGLDGVEEAKKRREDSLENNVSGKKPWYKKMFK